MRKLSIIAAGVALLAACAQAGRLREQSLVLTTATNAVLSATVSTRAVQGWVESVVVVPPAASTGDVQVVLAPVIDDRGAETVVRAADLAAELLVVPARYFTDADGTRSTTNTPVRPIAWHGDTWTVTITNATPSKTWRVYIRTEQDE